MNAADIAALATGIAGCIGAVTALIKVLQHNRDTASHIDKNSGSPQS